MLRYDYWCRNGKIPFTFIVTGEDNPSAVHFATRECLHGLYRQIKNKTEAIHHLCGQYQLAPEEIACFGDDVSDLSMAALCGFRKGAI